MNATTAKNTFQATRAEGNILVVLIAIVIYCDVKRCSNFEWNVAIVYLEEHFRFLMCRLNQETVDHTSS